MKTAPQTSRRELAISRMRPAAKVSQARRAGSSCGRSSLGFLLQFGVFGLAAEQECHHQDQGCQQYHAFQSRQQIVREHYTGHGGYGEHDQQFFFHRTLQYHKGCHHKCDAQNHADIGNVGADGIADGEFTCPGEGCSQRHKHLWGRGANRNDSHTYDYGGHTHIPGDGSGANDKKVGAPDENCKAGDYGSGGYQHRRVFPVKVCAALSLGTRRGKRLSYS